LFAVGGGDGTNFRDTLETYNPATNIWTTKPSMPTGRADLAAGVVGRTLYAIGGLNLGGDLNTVEAFTSR
jgi:hypothetical protein